MLKSGLLQATLNDLQRGPLLGHKQDTLAFRHKAADQVSNGLRLTSPGGSRNDAALTSCDHHDGGLLTRIGRGDQELRRGRQLVNVRWINLTCLPRSAELARSLGVAGQGSNDAIPAKRLEICLEILDHRQLFEAEVPNYDPLFYPKAGHMRCRPPKSGKYLLKRPTGSELLCIVEEVF